MRNKKPAQQRPSDMPVFLTAKELEAMLKIDVKTIYRYVRRGLIPYVRIQSNIRFDRSRILRWVHRRSSEPSANQAA
jgi:excisionase family DNA binding protein